MSTETHDLFYLRLGAWLKRQRESMQLSRLAMEEKIGCSSQQIQKYENASNRIPVDKLVLWCRICATSIQSAISAGEGH